MAPSSEPTSANPVELAELVDSWNSVSRGLWDGYERLLSRESAVLGASSITPTALAVPGGRAVIQDLDNHTKFVESIRDALLTADNASVVGGIITVSASEVAGVLLELPRFLAAMSPQRQAQYVRDHPDMDPSVAGLLDERAKEILADEVSDDIASHGIDAATIEVMALFEDDDTFAHRLFSTTTPRQLANAVHQLSIEAFPASYPADLQTRLDATELYARFLGHAGHTFATYTTATGKNSPPADLADTWYDAITDDAYPANAAALTLLIKHGGQTAQFDSGFLGDLTDQVYEWERSFDGDAVWGPRNEQLGDYGIKDPYVDDGIPLYRGGWDGVANLLGAMKNTPLAAEQFFAAADTRGYEGERVNERLHYLLVERIWPTDDGDGLGIALEGATTHTRDRSDSGKASAMLASQTVFVVSRESGAGSSWRPGDHGWHVPVQMTDSLGKMMASYMPDVHRAAQEGRGDVLDGTWIHNGGKAPYGMRVIGDDVATTLREVGRNDDKTGMEHVIAAAITHHGTLMSDTIDGLSHEGRPPRTMEELETSTIVVGGVEKAASEALANVADSSGATLAFVMDNGYLGGEGGELDAQSDRDSIARAFSIGADLLPSSNVPLVNVISGEALDVLEDGIRTGPPSATSEWADDTDRAMDNSLTLQMHNILLNEGFLNVGDQHGMLPPDAVRANDGLPLEFDTHGVLVIDPDRPLHIDSALYSSDQDVDPRTKDSFNAWLDHDPDFAQGAIEAYSSSLPNFR